MELAASDQGKRELTEMARKRKVLVASVTDARRDAAQDKNNDASSIDLRAMYAIGGGSLPRYRTNHFDNSVKSRLVLEAIRRSSCNFARPSEHEIRDFRGLNAVQQRAAANEGDLIMSYPTSARITRVTAIRLPEYTKRRTILDLTFRSVTGRPRGSKGNSDEGCCLLVQ